LPGHLLARARVDVPGATQILASRGLCGDDYAARLAPCVRDR
jgi:hypothetical protein